MAKGKKKIRKKAPSGVRPADDEQDDVEAGAEADDEEGAGEPEEAAAAAQDSPEDDEPEETPRPAKRGGKGMPALAVDPNLPRRDGGRVSHNGGLYFVGVILALILTAVVVQFALGE